MKTNGFLGLNRYSILSELLLRVSDDSLGDTPVPHMRTQKLSPRTPEVVGVAPCE